MKALIIRLLLKLYPKAWRAEYGEELRAMLQASPLTAGRLADVIWRGSLERFRSTEPWTLVAAASLIAVLALPRGWMQADGRCLAVYLVVGFWTRLRGGRPVLASVKLGMLAAAGGLVGLLLLAPGYYRVIGVPELAIAALASGFLTPAFFGWLGAMAAGAFLRLRGRAA